MPRGTIGVQNLVLGDGTINSSGVGTIDPANGAYIPALSRTRDLFLYVKNTGAVGTVFIQPGISTYAAPAFRSGLGTVSVVIPGTAERYITIESARHVQLNGDINIDYNTGMTGTIYAYRLPVDA